MLIQDIEYVLIRHLEPEAARQTLLDYRLLDLEQRPHPGPLRSHGDARGILPGL